MICHLPALRAVCLHSCCRLQAKAAVLERRHVPAPKINMAIPVVHEQHPPAPQLVLVEVNPAHREGGMQWPTRRYRAGTALRHPRVSTAVSGVIYHLCGGAYSHRIHDGGLFVPFLHLYIRPCGGKKKRETKIVAVEK